MSIIKLLTKKPNRLLFTTPSHSQSHPFLKKFKNSKFSSDLTSFYKHDYSEIEGFDNLADPKSSILLAQGKASDIFKTKQTFFITQGATTAIHAAMKTLIAPGDRILVARNCHKSVYNGLILTAGIVDWFIPETDSDWGIYTTIDPDKLKSTLELNQYKVFIMTSPTYEGINSDIERISEICHQHNTYLIVDEAHGSLYNFTNNLFKTAINQGADISINSLHKTAGALNQTALLHINSKIKNIDAINFQNSLNLFQTSSPSYPLLANIEDCINYLSSKDGKNEINNLIDEIDKIQKELTKFGYQFYENKNHDITKILVKKEGVSGLDLSETMFCDYNIEDELCNNLCCLYLAGIGTTKQKLEKLKSALKSANKKVTINPNQNDLNNKTDVFQPYPIVKIQPVDAFNRDFIYIKKENSLLKISNKLILPYPPGIGLLYPGEAIQEWHLEYLNNDVEVII